jgi:polyhydroxyalkanoate synthesis regulator phasin
MKVTTYIINEGADDQEVILINAKEGSVLRNVPNDWKTKKAAIRWALNNGLEVVQDRETEEQPDEIQDTKIAELTERIDKLEEKLRDYENAWKALRKIFQMSEK